MELLRIDLQGSKFVPFVAMAFIVCYISISFFDMGMFTMSYAAFAGLLGSFLLSFFLFLRRRELDMFELSIILFLFFQLSLSLLNGTNVKGGLYITVTILSFLLLFRYYKTSYKWLLLSTLMVLSVGVYCQLVQCVMHPEMWLIEGDKELHGYLLGGNYNQMGSRLLLALVLSLISLRYSKWFWLNTVPLFLCAIGNLLMIKSMTALSCIILFSLLCTFTNKSLQKISLIGIFIAVILFQILVCFTGKGLENNELAVWFIEDILNKDITFTGRTDMWDAALRVIYESPIWGYGFVDNDWFFSNMSTQAIGAHNYVLNTMICGGIIGLMMYFSLIYQSLTHVICYKDAYTYRFVAAFAVFCVMMLFEVYETTLVFLLLSFMYYYPESTPEIIPSIANERE